MGLFGKVSGKEGQERQPPLRHGDRGGTRGRGGPAACESAIHLGRMQSGDRAVVPGCKRCHQLNDNAQAAASKAGGAVSVEYVTDPVAIAEAGIMATPALRERQGRLAGRGARAIGDRGAPVGGSRYLTGCVLRLTAVTS